MSRPRNAHSGRNCSRIPSRVTGSARLAPDQPRASGGQAEEDLAREGVVPGMQGRQLAEEIDYADVVGQPVEQDLAGGDRVLGVGRFL